MPIYEYICASCDARFEKLVRSMSDPPPAPCPKCGSRKTSRQFSAFAVSSSQASSPPAGGCGRCGMNGSCPMMEE